MGTTANITSTAPAVPSGTQLGDVASGLYGPAYKEAEKIDRQTDEGIKKIESEKAPTPPKMAEAPKPENYQTDPMQEFGSAAMFLSVFGSLLTKQPLTNALKSGAAVMQARNQGDANAFKQAMDKWKVDTGNAWKMANWQQDVYKAAIAKDEAELKARAVSFKDEVMLHMADAKMAQQAIRDREKALKKAQGPAEHVQEAAQTAYDKAIADGKSEEVANVKYMEAYGNALKTTKGQGDKDKVTITPGAVDTYANAVHGGVKLSAFGLGYGTNANKTAVMNRVAEKYPNFDMAQAEASYGGVAQESRTVGAAAGRIKLAANSLDNAIPLARSAADKVDLSQFPSLNALENKVRSGTGDPNIIALNTAIQTVISDYSSLIARNGQQTEGTRIAAREMVNSNMVSGQLDAFFEQVEKEKTAQLNAVKETEGKGLAGKPPDAKHLKMLKENPTEQNQKYFDEAFGEGTAAQALGK